MDRKEYLKIHRQKLKTKGICILCEKKKAEKGFKSCLPCRIKARNRLQNLSLNPDWKHHKNELVKKRRDFKRIEAMKMIAKGNPKCISCGCEDLRVLEINHIKMNGKIDHHNQDRFISEILKGKRNLNEFDIRCKVCNIAHYCQEIFGLSWAISFPDLSKE